MSVDSTQNLLEEIRALKARVAELEKAPANGRADQPPAPKPSGPATTEYTHLSLLAEIGTLLSSSLDYEQTLANLARLLVPTMADWCTIHMLEPEAIEPRQVALYHSDPAKIQWAYELQQQMSERYPYDPESSTGLPQVLRSGQPELYPDIPDQLLVAVARDEEQLATLRQIGYSSVMIVPLLARGRVLGAIQLVATESGRHYTRADLDLAQEVAGRAALAVDNARLYHEARQAIERQEESLALLDTLLDSAPIGLAFVDRQMRFIRINEAMAAINHLPVQAHLNRTIREVLPEMTEQTLSVIRQVLETGQPVTNLEIGDDSLVPVTQARHFLASYYPVKAAADVIGLGAVVLEITDRKKAEITQRFLAEASRLLSSSLDYQTTLNSLAGLAVTYLGEWCLVDIVGPDQKVERLAVAHPEPERVKEAYELLGNYSPDPALPVGLSRVLQTGQSELYPEISLAIERLKPGQTSELTALRQMGARSYMVVPLAARGKILGALTFIATGERRYQPTDLALAEELAVRAGLALDNARLYRDLQDALLALQELDRLKDQFISIASHELRTPLTSIKGFAQVLKRLLDRQTDQPEPDISGQPYREKSIRGLASILHQVDRMQDLIDDMLDVTRIQNGRLELKLSPEIELGELIRQVVRQHQTTDDNHRLLMDLPEDAVAGMLDEGRIEQVLNNLIGNAIKYSPSQTTITIGLRCQEQNRPNPEATIWVQDQGPGITPEDRARIFERFYRASTISAESIQVDGLGLGLYISHEIVARHGGQMWVESEPGAGSTFRFTLPLNLPAVTGQEQGEGEVQADGK